MVSVRDRLKTGCVFCRAFDIHVVWIDSIRDANGRALSNNIAA
jgi:hypothetical protein